MKRLVDDLVISFEAIRSEQEPAALKNRLATHETLLKQLQAKAEEKCPMMVMMENTGEKMTHPPGQ
jgi:hypothetical protein